MGQQQLLLLVLGIVIVGLAVVAGINAFSENQQKSSQDALTQEAFRLATDANAWFEKPTQFGGGAGNSDNLTADAPTWQDIGVYDVAEEENYTTPWGEIGKSNAAGIVTFELYLQGETAEGEEFGTVTFDPSAARTEQIMFERAGTTSGS